jgi:hypothetical protein
MTGSTLAGLLKIFDFEKKSGLVRYCRNLQINGDDFISLILSCDASGVPFTHKISHREIIPPHLVPSDSEHQALRNNAPGPLSSEAEKFVRKISQIFKDRKIMVGHMFYTPDFSRWHFFCFDQRDLEENTNHWKEGAHVHFINWLWKKLDAKSVWSVFVSDNARPTSVIHLRFSSAK